MRDEHDLIGVRRVYRRHGIWLVPHFLAGAALLGATAALMVSPLIHSWQARLIFAAVQLWAMLWFGLRPYLRWRTFRIIVGERVIAVREGAAPAERGHIITRAGCVLTLEGRPLASLLRICTLTLRTPAGDYRYELMTPADG